MKWLYNQDCDAELRIIEQLAKKSGFRDQLMNTQVGEAEDGVEDKEDGAGREKDRVEDEEDEAESGLDA
jgi:hypothetical protein